MTGTVQMLTRAEIAQRAGVSQQAVSNWLRRHPDFPRPQQDDLFAAPAVDEWLRRRGSTSRRQAAVQGKLWKLLDEAPNREAAIAAALALLVEITVYPDALADPLQSISWAEKRGGLPEGALSLPLMEAVELLPRQYLRRLEEAVATTAAQKPAAEHYEEILYQAARRRLAFMEHGTAGSVANLIPALIPDAPQSVLDPCSGVGGILLAVARRYPETRLHGVEISPQAWAVSVQRMRMHNIESDLELGDYFTAGQHQYDCVVAHPPLGVSWPEDSAVRQVLRRYGVESAGRLGGDFAWLLAARDALTAAGRAVVVTAPSLAFGSGTTRTLRHELLRSGSVDAVIALPPGALSVTAIAPIVWVLRPPTATPADVLFINASDAPFSKAAGNTERRVSDQYQQWRRNPRRYQPKPGFSATVPVLQLLTGDVVLTPSLWTDIAITPEVAVEQASAAATSLTHIASELGFEVPNLSLKIADAPRFRSLQDLAVDGLVEVRRPPHTNRDDVSEQGLYPYVSGVMAADLKVTGYIDELPDRAVVTQPGDVVLATVGQVRAVLDHDGGHVLGQALWLIRPTTDDPRMDPDLLSLLLSTQRVGARALGTTVPRLRHPKDVMVPWLEQGSAIEAAAIANQLAWIRRHAARLVTESEQTAEALATALESGASLRGEGAATTMHRQRQQKDQAARGITSW